MERPLKSDGLDDMDELRQAFTKRVIPPALEERLLGSEKLRRDLLGLATEDEAYLFIRKADMSSQLRSQLLVESPVISTNKTTSRPTPTPRPATKDDGTNQSLQSSRHSYLTRLPGSQVASNSSFATSTLTHITHKCETPNLLAKDKLPTKDSTSVAPVKRIFTAKRTFPPYSIPKSNLTKKLPELVGNKTVISASSISPGPTRIVSDILQVPIGIRLLLNTSNQKEDVKNPLATNQTIPQQLYNGRLNDPHIPDEQEKDLKRKRDTPSSGVSWDSHPQKSRKGNSTNTPSETLDAASSKTHSKNELSPANRKRSRLKASQELRSKDVDGLAESAHGHTEDSAYNPTSSSNNVSNDIESSKVDAINSRVPNTDVASNTNPNSLASHRRLLIDENSDEIDDDILLRKLNIPAKATKPDWNYHIWTFPSGETQATSGALLPRGYTLHDHPDAPWICPIRSCRVLFSKLDGLGAHFNVSTLGSGLA
ncbi:hypothetical protein F4814DRAFT_288345 [Daldinia grandis]|nr:hypothetical protein F4814DRAFT_288345 [Daldinia grandis]